MIIAGVFFAAFDLYLSCRATDFFRKWFTIIRHMSANLITVFFSQCNFFTSVFRRWFLSVCIPYSASFPLYLEIRTISDWWHFLLHTLWENLSIVLPHTFTSDWSLSFSNLRISLVLGVSIFYFLTVVTNKVIFHVFYVHQVFSIFSFYIFYL